MKALYVAPRYHINQVPIIRGWLQNGHQVMFISQLAASSEDHKDLKPVILGYSRIFNGLFSLVNKIKHRNHPDALFAVSSKRGFPPYFRLRKLIRDFAPDVAILRERSLYNIIVHLICKRYRIPCILYNQSPYWNQIPKKKGRLWKTVRRLSPKYRITPVLGSPGKGKYEEPNSRYVPFVMEPAVSPDEKTYCMGGTVQLLCVGRYMECKKQLVQLEVLKRLIHKYPVHLTFAGEVVSGDQKAYFKQVIECVERDNLQNYVTILTNLPHEKVYDEYRKADLFLLPSTEVTSVSQLEAMSCALPVICSNLDGKASYIRDGVNGLLVEPGNADDLEEKIEYFLNHREKIEEMGRTNYRTVVETYSFGNYYRQICEIAEQIKKEGAY